MTLSPRSTQRGAAMVIALVALLVITLIASTVLRSLLALHRQSRAYERQLQAAWLADSALARAAAQLAADDQFSGETWTVVLDAQAGHRGVAVISVELVDGQPARRKVVVAARYPDDPVQRVLASREQILNVPSAEESP